MARITQLAASVKASREPRPKKINWLRGKILDGSSHLKDFDPVPIPLNSQVIVKGINASTSSIFKSSQSPLLIDFICSEESNYAVIYKSGDDLRQDQLMLQIMRLIDRILREQNLDLRLTLYRILPLGSSHGLVQYIPSVTLTDALVQGNGSLIHYLRALNTDHHKDTVDPHIMENFVRSCAGYCVITYLLGVGDRHSENIMIRPEGYLFHIDFGFILGRDPKPFSPLMKVSRELIDGMGGLNSQHFLQFQSYCITAFMILRKRVNLILSLFTLMQDSNISDIRYQSDKALTKLRSRFCLEMSDDDAVSYLRQLILESSSSFFPQLMDRAHNIAQFFRS